MLEYIQIHKFDQIAWDSFRQKKMKGSKLRGRENKQL